MTAFSEDILSADDFEAVLAVFCSYGYYANAFKAVEKIDTDEKYHKCSLCIIVC